MASESIGISSNTSDLAKRQQAWAVLSELFVDTELSDDALNSIARQLNDLHLDVASAEHILFEEVAPVFGKNMLSVAGNWTGWHAQDVNHLVSAWIDKRDAPGLLGMILRLPVAAQLRKKFTLFFVKHEWQKVVDAMACLE